MHRSSDGGVYFSTLGPAAYELGTREFETNIIVDCFGVERLEEYRGKGMLDLCLVYGAEAGVLTQAPGGRDNAKMVTKTLFQSLALPAADGNYFLRADRILAAFLLPASEPPVGYAEAKEALAAERAADAATIERLTTLQRHMKKNGTELREAHLELQRTRDIAGDVGMKSSRLGLLDSGIGGDVGIPSMTSLSTGKEGRLASRLAISAFGSIQGKQDDDFFQVQPRFLPLSSIGSTGAITSDLDASTDEP
jgi:hypothetical protein